MCRFTKKLKLQLILGDEVPQNPYWDSAPGPRGGIPSPRPQSSFVSPNNPVRSTPLRICTVGV